jgi:hypothetical protein
MVFPFGHVHDRDLPAVAGHRLLILAVILHAFIFVALAAWLVVFAGLLRHLWGSLWGPAAARSRVRSC